MSRLIACPVCGVARSLLVRDGVRGQHVLCRKGCARAEVVACIQDAKAVPRAQRSGCTSKAGVSSLPDDPFQTDSVSNGDLLLGALLSTDDLVEATAMVDPMNEDDLDDVVFSIVFGVHMEREREAEEPRSRRPRKRL
jgi:hypothetical protein